jgi:hypothetical protein
MLSPLLKDTTIILTDGAVNLGIEGGVETEAEEAEGDTLHKEDVGMGLRIGRIRNLFRPPTIRPCGLLFHLRSQKINDGSYSIYERFLHSIYERPTSLN